MVVHRNEIHNANTEKLQRIYQKDPPSKSSIFQWKKNFLETGSISGEKRSGSPCTSDFDVEHVRETFLHNPRRSVRSAARELDMPISTVYKVIKKILRLCAYKVQIIQILEPDDRPRRMAFATDMLRRIEDDAEFLKCIMFSDEASFHLSAIVNRHNVCIWGSVNPHEYREAQRDSPKSRYLRNRAESRKPKRFEDYIMVDKIFVADSEEPSS
ncbi:hypothetical protein X975_02434, partial [Stegodyphus mimosarum]